MEYRENILLSKDQYEKLLKEYGIDKLNWMLDHLHSKKGSKGYEYKSDYHALLPAGWVNEACIKHHMPKNGSKSEGTAVPSEENKIINRKSCDAIEGRIRDRFTTAIFFEAQPLKAILRNKPKDILKEYEYDRYDPKTLKEILFRDLEQCFPGVIHLLSGKPKSDINNLIEVLKEQMIV